MSSKIPTLAARVKANPDDSFSKFALALELLKLDQVSKAQLLFEIIMDNDPDYIGVYYHLAKLYTEINENKKALETYKKGIKIAEALDDQHAKSELQGALLALELEMDYK
ncbi:MAG: tetratricopeptide repeat protein [Balneola sp.]